MPRGGGGHHKFASIKVMRMRLGGQIVCPKMFPVRSTTGNVDIMCHGNQTVYGGHLKN